MVPVNVASQSSQIKNFTTPLTEIREPKRISHRHLDAGERSSTERARFASARAIA
jgi:hypothetical protein